MDALNTAEQSKLDFNQLAKALNCNTAEQLARRASISLEEAKEVMSGLSKPSRLLLAHMQTLLDLAEASLPAMCDREGPARREEFLALVKENSFSRTQVAEALGISKNYVSMISSGLRNPSERMIRSLRIATKSGMNCERALHALLRDIGFATWSEQEQEAFLETIRNFASFANARCEAVKKKSIT